MRAQAEEPIAIIGIGCRLPGGANSAQAFWTLLREGRAAISEVPPERWDLATHFNPDPTVPLHQHVRRGGFVDGIDQFDAAFFGITPREALCMDPQQRLLLEVAWQAFEDGGQPLEVIRGQRVGVFMGISSSDYSSLLWASPENYRIPDNEPFVLPGNTGCIAANRLSYFFDLKGPSFTVDTACSSSLVAVHLACESIWRGESTAALAGGVQALIHPGIQSSFCKAGLLAPDGRCKSFDAAADGYVRSEGAGAVLLKPLAAAQADGDPIVALIHGTAVNSDGRSNGMVAPNLRAQVACVRDAFERAGIDPAATQYVEAHGTGTRQGDPIELRALGTVLGEGRSDEQPCRVGSVKTNLGHSETAAGITGLIKAALCVQHRQLPPSLNFRSPNPSIDFTGLKLQVQTELEPFPRADQPAVVGVSSFGFGGTNAHVVLADAPKPPPPPRYGQCMPFHVLALSARTEEALRQQAAGVAALLKAKPNLPLADLCATANVRRSHFVRRLVCLGPDRTALLAQLEAHVTGSGVVAGGGPGVGLAGAVAGQASRRPGKLAWLFTGQGSQALGMAQGLHAHHPVFREAFERCTALLDPLLEAPLASVLFPPEGHEEQAATQLSQTSFTQPAVFVVGYALAQLWTSWGLKADLLMGHSVGEIVAAQLAGVFSLDDAVKLVVARGRLMQALPKGGGMVALLASAEQVEHLIAASQQPAASGLAIAAYNGPTNTVVSGPQKELEVLVKVAASAGMACHPLAVSHAFHSPAMAPMLEAFEQVLRQIRFSPPSRPLVSNVTGELAGPEIAQSDYWCDHVLSPVHFAQGMATLVAQGAVTFVELGAKPTLLGMGRQCLEAGTPNSNAIGSSASTSTPGGSYAWWPSLRPGLDDWQVLLRSLAELHRSGYPVDWKGFHRPFPHRLVALPGYPFQRQRYWWSRPNEGEAPASLWLSHIAGLIPTTTSGSTSGPTSGSTPISGSTSGPTSISGSTSGPTSISGSTSGPTSTPALGTRGAAPMGIATGIATGIPTGMASSAGAAAWLGLEPLALPGGQERRYRTRLAPDAPFDLGDHRIRSQVVFPAAGFVQLALQAAQAQELPLALADLSLDQPLRLPDAGAELQLVWSPSGIEFHSSTINSSVTHGGAINSSAGQAAVGSAGTTWRSHGVCRAGAVGGQTKDHSGGLLLSQHRQTSASPHQPTTASAHRHATALPHQATAASLHADVAVQRFEPVQKQQPPTSSGPSGPFEPGPFEPGPFDTVPFDTVPSDQVPFEPTSPPAGAEALDLAGFYGALERFGLRYGPAFRSLVSVSSHGDRAWARLERQSSAAGAAQDWALLDGCFQAVAATLDPEAAAGQLFLPVGLDALELSQWPLPDRLQCQVQLRSSEEAAFVLADLLLLDEARPLGWIRGFRLRRLPRAALDWLFPLEAAAEPEAAERGVAQWLVRAEWEPLPATATEAKTVSEIPLAALPQQLVRASALGSEPLQATAALLALAQNHGQAPATSPIWLLLDTPENPALSGALEGFAKAAALEQGQRQWLRIHLLLAAGPGASITAPPATSAPPVTSAVPATSSPVNTAELVASLPWGEIEALAASELALAWDGRQLFRQRLRPLLPERFRFTTRSVGLLESLEPTPLTTPLPALGHGEPSGGALAPALAPGELELAVEATGLNFRDVLNALGLLRAYSRQLGLDEAAQVPFGGEAVGTVTAVGSGVDLALVGTRVVAALAVGSLASHVTTRAELCVPLPAALTPAEGASVSTAFLTAIYGLQSLAGLKHGETVLIHAAAGGVGQAAVQVAQRAGARILATASAAKQAGLLEQGVEAVFDSRSLDFAEQVRAHTGGRGVDVVLNSLKGDWVDASFEALAEGGRFVELGKIEIWSRRDAAERRPDASYLPFDLLEVAAAQPQLVRMLLEQLMADLVAGRYQLLPIQEFPVSQTVEAFRLMAQARHVGKVVITNPDAMAVQPLAAAPVLADATYLVTGALGGLGLQLVKWLADQGATSLLVLARSAAAPSAGAAALLAQLERQGVSCTLLPCDLAATGAAAAQAEQQLAAALAAVEPAKPLRGVFHAAGVLHDGLLQGLTPEGLERVLAPKLGGWQLLERVLGRVATAPTPAPTPVTPAPFVVHFSSMASLLGSPGQANYCAANAALDALATRAALDASSRVAGLRQLAIQWGPWDGAGMAGALGERERQRLAALGVRLLPPPQAFEALEQLLRRGVSGAVGVLDLDWARLGSQASPRQAALLEPLVARAQAQAAAAGPAGAAAAEPPAYLKVLHDTPPLERHSRLVGFVRLQLAKVMGLADPEQIDPTEPLFNMGLDSLMALELTVLLENNLGVRLTESLVFEHPTVDDLVHHFLREVLFPDDTPPGVPSAPAQATYPAGAEPAPAWDQQVADVAALDTADLLKQLRGE